MKQVFLNDPDAPVDFNLIVSSPHVVAYRVWTQEPGAQDWEKVAEGTSGDDVPDHKSLGSLTAGTTILYWLAVGGHPDTPFQLLVTFGQGGAVLAGGDCAEAGVVSASGSVAIKRKVALHG